jgi:hypothetical protein
MNVYHVSGHLDLTEEEFNKHYRDSILNAISEGSSFVIGDAAGADAMAQKFLFEHGITNVIVYHMFDKPRNNIGFKTIGGFTSDRERDEALTVASNDDIAWVRPGREKSGTAKNLTRRKLQDTI